MMVIWITLVVLAVCGVFGWRAGVVKRLLELAGVLAAVIVTSRLASSIAPWIAERTELSDTAVLVAANVLTFVAALVAVRLLASVISTFIRWTPLGWLDRLGGAVCGVLLGALVVSVGLIAVSQAPGGGKIRAAYTDHPVGEFIYHAAPSLYQGVHRLFGGEVDALWKRAVDLGEEVVEEVREEVQDAAEEATGSGS